MEQFVRCKECNGHYIIREGTTGTFAGCSNYPRCRSTVSVEEFVYRHFAMNGINVYCWNKFCWKCNKATPVYSYYLKLDLSKVTDLFKYDAEVGIGSFESLDRCLRLAYPSITQKYSRTVNGIYTANTCVHCGSLQGRNYVVEDPHEIFHEYFFEENLDKFLVARINFAAVDKALFWKEIRAHFHP